MSEQLPNEFDPQPEMPETPPVYRTVEELGGDAASVVTILTPAGAPVYQPMDEPAPLSEVLRAASLTVVGAYDAYMDGAPVTLNTVIAPGSTVSIIGNVKGA